MFSDEAFFAGDRAQAGMMKGLITERTRMIEKKYMDAQEVQNFTRLILASNEQWIIPMDWDDRRWFVLDVLPAQQGNRIYFTEMMQEWKEGGKEAFMWFLKENIAKQSDFDSYNFEREKIMTAAAIDQTLFTNDAYGWYVDVLDRGYFRYKDEDGNKQRITINETETNYFWNTQEIYDDFCDYCKASGNKRPGPKQKLSADLNKLKITFNSNKRKVVEGLGRPSIWEFASLNKLKEEWELMTGDYRWSKQEVLPDDSATMIESILPETVRDSGREKRKKIVGKLGELE